MIYFLDGNQEVIKIVRNSAILSAIQTQELPEDSSLLRDYLSVRLKNDERLFNAQYMAVKSHGGNRNSFDLHRIASETVPDNATEFMGVQVAPYELEGVVVEDLRPNDREFDQLMMQILAGTDWSLGFTSSNIPNVTTNFYYMSVKDALKKLQSLLGVEMIFKVEISGNRVTSKWVEVYRQLGNRTMKRFNYGTNALSVVRESSQSELYTALIGRGKGEEVGEGHGRAITFEDVEWSIANGDPVDKPLGQKYIELPQATEEYGIKLIDGRKVPRIGIVEFNDTEDPELLIQQVYEELLVRARPKVLFSASVTNTGDMLIGDTVTIHRHDLGFHYQARVRKVVRDRKNNNQTQVEIGDVVHTPSTKRQGQINSALNNVASDLENVRGEITEARQSADGKNTNFYGNVEPDRKKVGDTWFRDHPSLTGESQILVWNGEAWELIMDTSETTKNADAIEAVIEQAQIDRTELEREITQTYEDAVNEADRLAAIRDDGITITAGQIRAGIIDTARLDAVSIVTSGLSANVVKANHIQADDALFDKLFATTLATDRLSAQQAWIKNINIADASIDGAKIQDATIGSAKIADLDVGKISGETSNFVQSNWNSAVGGGVSISGDRGVRTLASGGEMSILENGGLNLYDRSTTYAGKIDSSYNNEGFGGISIFIRATKHFSVVRESGTVSNPTYNPIFYVEGGSNILQTNVNFGFKGNNIVDIQSMRFSGGSAAIRRQASDNVEITTHGEDNTAVLFGRTTAQFHRSIDMNGNNITNQSDYRLKRDIDDTELDSLASIKSWEIVDFNWIDDELNKRNGRQMGVIAQDTPDLAMYDAETDTWSINSSKQIMMNTHAIQQLALREESTNLVASQALEATESNESKIHKLQQELSKANRRIEELESVV